MPMKTLDNLRQGMHSLACALLLAMNTAVANDALFLVDVQGILEIAREEVYEAHKELPADDLYLGEGIFITCPPPGPAGEVATTSETPEQCALTLQFRLASTVREIWRLDPAAGCVPGEAFEAVSVQLLQDGSVASLSRSRCTNVPELFMQCTGGPEPTGMELEYGPCPYEPSEKSY